MKAFDNDIINLKFPNEINCNYKYTLYRDLVQALIVSEKDRIDWNDYFNHAFFM